MNHLEYRGYHAPVEYEAGSDVSVGRLAGISDIITFEADNVNGLKTAFVEAVDDYLAHCEKTNKSPQKAYSGKLMLRVSPSVHAKVALASELSHARSMNEFAEQALDEAAERLIAAG